MSMRDGIIYDCPHANCRTPIDTGKCSKACIARYNKEMGKKPMTNADRIRAMSDEELSVLIKKTFIGKTPWCDHHCKLDDDCSCNGCLMEWLKQPAEE